MKAITLLLICLIISGCSGNQPVIQTEIVYRTIPEALLVTCKVVEPVVSREALTSYEEAFYAVSEAYIATSRSVDLCNSVLSEAIKYNERLEESKQ